MKTRSGKCYSSTDNGNNHKKMEIEIFKKEKNSSMNKLINLFNNNLFINDDCIFDKELDIIINNFNRNCSLKKKTKKKDPRLGRKKKRKSK